jgi:hypothetical protein
VLHKGKLIIYHDEKEYVLKVKDKCKNIEMRSVTNVCFHYDKDAPVKSKKLHSDKVDTSRFDLYTKDRLYQFKASLQDCQGDSVQNSANWVAALQEAIEFF